MSQSQQKQQTEESDSQKFQIWDLSDADYEIPSLRNKTALKIWKRDYKEIQAEIRRTI